ncbi:MAG: glutaredoxin family protein, partial [Bacteroidota bacterium]
MEQVTVYTTPTCPWCDRLKDYLREKGVSYNEV